MTGRRGMGRFRWPALGAVALASGLVLGVALGPFNAQGSPHQRSLLVFGTIVELTIREPEALAERAFSQAESTLRRMHANWKPWGSGSLAQINHRLASGEWVEAPPSLVELIATARPLAQQSDYHFDPGIGHLVALWGFHEPPDNATRQPPSEAALRDWRADPASLADLRVQDQRLKAQHPDLMLDFGGFAKGVALDDIIEAWQGLGIENALINAGGDLRGLGTGPGRSWRIGIRHPRGDGVLAAVSLHDGEAAFTSGDYERHFDFKDKHYHHLLDSRSARPARGLLSVTVLDDHAARADAAATALFVAGPEDWPRIARRLTVDAVLVVQSDGAIVMTPSMAERVDVLTDAPTEVRTLR